LFATPRQRLTLIHFSAQPEQFLTQKHTLNTHLYSLTSLEQPPNTPPIPQKANKLS
jgi:hypothetical protein